MKAQRESRIENQSKGQTIHDDDYIYKKKITICIPLNMLMLIQKYSWFDLNNNEKMYEHQIERQIAQTMRYAFNSSRFISILKKSLRRERDRKRIEKNRK